MTLGQIEGFTANLKCSMEMRSLGERSLPAKKMVHENV
jgi:hypothetical protein